MEFSTARERGPIGESSGRKWGTRHRVSKGDGSLGCCAHPCRYWHRGTHNKMNKYGLYMGSSMSTTNLLPHLSRLAL
eukprot:7801170-Pyramimonas_sp.AAC.1